MEDIILKLEGITKSYGEVKILKDISLEMKKGEIISIVGASGSGKTTLLEIIGSIEKANSGKVLIDNININDLNNKEKAKFRNKYFGFIFQFHNLFSEFTVRENIMIPLLINKKNKNKEIDENIKLLLQKMNIYHLIDKKPSQISGGEQQRVAIARAMINKPLLILADEPTGNLDENNSEEIFNLFLKLRKESNISLVLVTHNEKLADRCDKKYELTDGKLFEKSID